MTVKSAFAGFGAFLFCACLSPSLSYGQPICAPVLTLPNLVQTPFYDPFAQGPTIDEVPLSFQKTDCGPAADVDLTFGLAGGEPRLVRDGQDLRFSVLLGGTDLTSTLTANSVRLSLPEAASGILSTQAQLIIPEGQVVAPGLYRFTLPGLATAQSGLLTTTIDGVNVRATPITISTQVLAVMRLSVTGCDIGDPGAATNFQSGLASACRLTLGDMTAGMANGDQTRARIQAQANVNFKIAMVSRNGGVLKLAGGRDEARDTEQIHYRASLEGQGQTWGFSCAASDCGSSETFQPATSPLGSELYFHILVADPTMSAKRAGVYGDVITLIIQPAS